ncbi:hypothetical protein ACFRNK_04420, partial [Streptomyces sp. NPDC056756]
DATASPVRATGVLVGGATAVGALVGGAAQPPPPPGVVSLIAAISGLPLEADAEGGARQCEDTDSPAQWWRLEPV